MKYIDFHNHLLPEVDDGAHSMEEALDSLRLLRSQGVTTAVLTPHINSSFASRPGVTKETINETFRELKEACEIDPEDYLNVMLGSEYYFDPRLEDHMDPLTVDGFNLVLLELPYEIDLAGVIQAVDIGRRQNFRIILAHPEKYDAFKYQWDEALIFLKESPDVLVQLETWDVAKLNEYSWRFINSRVLAVMGTDSHGYRRKPSYDKAVKVLTDWAAEIPERKEYVESLLWKNAAEILQGRSRKARQEKHGEPDF